MILVSPLQLRIFCDSKLSMGWNSSECTLLVTLDMGSPAWPWISYTFT